MRKRTKKPTPKTIWNQRPEEVYGIWDDDAECVLFYEKPDQLAEPDGTVEVAIYKFNGYVQVDNKTTVSRVK